MGRDRDGDEVGGREWYGEGDIVRGRGGERKGRVG